MASCHSYHGDSDKWMDVMGDVLVKVYGLAIKEGGWNPDNHVAYLTSMVKRRLFRDHVREKRKRECLSGWMGGEDGTAAVLSHQKVYGDIETRPLVVAALTQLRRRNDRFAAIVGAIYAGMDDNRELARHFQMSDDALRQAKRRAFMEFKEIWQKLLDGGLGAGRLPAKRSKAAGKDLKKDENRYHYKTSDTSAWKDEIYRVRIDSYHRITETYRVKAASPRDTSHGEGSQRTDDGRQGTAPYRMNPGCFEAAA